MSSDFESENFISSNEELQNQAALEETYESSESEAYSDSLKHSAISQSSQNLSADLNSIHEAIGDVTYEWDIASDRLVMSANAQNIFDFSDSAFSSSGKGFASCQDYNNQTNRYSAVFDGNEIDQGQGVPFQIEYLIKPHGREEDYSTWVEDTGRWFAGPDGKPQKVIGVLRRADMRRAREDAQRYASEYDVETGIYNRNALQSELEKCFTLSSVSGENFAFCLVAIDNLSVLNEAYGYEVADQIIPIVANRLKEVMRAGDMIGRYAGNKFGVILKECANQEVPIACERLVHAVSCEPVETCAGAINVTISIGSVIAPEVVTNSKKARAGAERALADAKKQLTVQYVNFQTCEIMESERSRNIQFVDDMLAALNERRFILNYQPIVDANSLETVYHECLVRMNDEQEGLIPASRFMPLAENLGLSGLIDLRVLEMTLSTLKENPQEKLAVNISGKTVNDREWLEYLFSFLSQNPNIAQRLMIEITETAALHEVVETNRFVSVLHDFGCQVAMDDFGAGYTSFTNLKNFEVDLVKIDGHFVENMAKCHDDQFFVRTLTELAKNFNMRTVAEWVSDQESVDLLRSWGVDYFQGNIFGEPQDRLMPKSQVQDQATACENISTL